MPSTRELVSGGDYQLRYALHRLMRLAVGLDPLSSRAARLRLEWRVAVDGGEIWVDALLEDGGGRVLEIIECKEHKGHVATKSIRSFFADVARLATRVPDGRFRFVTNARRLPSGGDPLRWKEPPVAADRIVWELDTPNKESLTAECIAQFAHGGGDPFVLYARLYARLAAQMAARLRRDGNVFIAAVRDLHTSLFSDVDGAALSDDLSLAGEESFSIDELRATLRRGRGPRGPPRAAARANVTQSIDSGLLSDSSVTLRQIFVEPRAQAVVQHGDEERFFSAEALSFLFQWLATSRSGGGGRLPGSHGAGCPLLVLGRL